MAFLKRKNAAKVGSIDICSRVVPETQCRPLDVYAATMVYVFKWATYVRMICIDDSYQIDTPYWPVQDQYLFQYDVSLLRAVGQGSMFTESSRFGWWQYLSGLITEGHSRWPKSSTSLKLGICSSKMHCFPFDAPSQTRRSWGVGDAVWGDFEASAVKATSFGNKTSMHRFLFGNLDQYLNRPRSMLRSSQRVARIGRKIFAETNQICIFLWWACRFAKLIENGVLWTRMASIKGKIIRSNRKPNRHAERFSCYAITRFWIGYLRTLFELIYWDEWITGNRCQMECFVYSLRLSTCSSTMFCFYYYEP